MTKRPEDIFLEELMAEKTAETLPPVETPAEPTPVALPPAPRVLTSRSVFSHPDAHAVALDVVLLKHFHLDWLSWLPDTLFSEIEQTFRSSIAEVNKLKILAAQTLHVTDAFWDQWEIFEKTLWALNGMIPRVEAIQPPDLSILFAGVDMADSIRKETFSEEIGRYCAAVFLNENVFYAPAPLSFCQDYITQPIYVCKDCGKHGSALPPFDGLCSSCAGHFQHSHPFSFKPDPDALKRGAGRNLDIQVTYNATPIKNRFEELDAMPASKVAGEIREVPEDIQAAKLIVATDFMKYRANQLSEQLGSLRNWLEDA